MLKVHSRRTFIGTAGAMLLAAPAASAGSTVFHYDSLGRITAALYPDGALNVYNYDPANNRFSFRSPYVGSPYNISDDGIDSEYYTIAYPYTRQTGMMPYDHFNSTWNYTKHNPSSYFNTAGYLDAYQDVAASGVNPLWQYMVQGWREGRDPSPLFNTRAYISNYADVAAADFNPLWHFLKAGYLEGRNTFGSGEFTKI